MFVCPLKKLLAFLWFHLIGLCWEGVDGSWRDSQSVWVLPDQLDRGVRATGRQLSMSLAANPMLVHSEVRATVLDRDSFQETVYRIVVLVPSAKQFRKQMARFLTP